VSILNEINIAKNALKINDHIDELTTIYSYKLSILIGMDENVVLIFKKFNVIKYKEYYYPSVSLIMTQLYEEIQSYDDERYENIVKTISLKYNAYQYNLTNERQYADNVFDIQMKLLNKNKHWQSLFDLIILCHHKPYYNHHLEKIISENLSVLESLEKSIYGSKIIPLIKSIINPSYEHLTPETKSHVETIFFNELYDKSLKNNEDVLVKYAGKC
jgi:hypothetical protein